MPVGIALEGRVFHRGHVVGSSLSIDTATGNDTMIAFQMEGVFARRHPLPIQGVWDALHHAALHALGHLVDMA